MGIVRKLFILTIFSMAAAIFITSCNPGGGSLVSPELNGGVTGNGNVTIAIQSESMDDHEVTITSAKVLLKDFEFVGAENNSIELISLKPVVVNIFTNGTVANFVVGSVIPGSYKRINFKIHKPSHNETINDPEFTENNEKYSVIIRGMYKGNPFVYRSKISVKKELHFSEPLTISEIAKVRIILVVSPKMWFIKNGDFMDPNNNSNRNQIDKNIRESFRWVYVEH